MKTIGRVGIATTMLLSLLLVAGCSDENSGDKNSPELTLDLGNNVTMKLVHIEAGKFMMGSKLSIEETAKRFGGRADDYNVEHPQRQVILTKPFQMGVTEVTQAQWQAVMNTQPWRFDDGDVRGRFKAGADHAASYIKWHDAVAFCVALSKKTGRTVRLPTEAEWEYACRAGTTTVFCFGDDKSKVDDYAWYRSNAHRKREPYAHPVGMKKPNAWGLYDMHANVCEWCADRWADSYANADIRDPKGPSPSTGATHVFRGGSWCDASVYCRAAARSWGAGNFASARVGFRVVVEVK